MAVREPIGKVPVSKRALFQRVNRTLKKQGKAIKTTRADRWREDLGDHYIIDMSRNVIVAGHIDLEEYGREIGALRDYEELRG